MILATLGTSMVKVLVVTRCHAQYGAVHNHRDLCDTPLGIASQGKSVEKALRNLREAIELHLEDEDAKVQVLG